MNHIEIKETIFKGKQNIPWSDVEKVKQMAETLHIPMDTYSGCNHSLESGDVLRNLEILQDVMEKTAVYLRNASPDQYA